MQTSPHLNALVLIGLLIAGALFATCNARPRLTDVRSAHLRPATDLEEYPNADRLIDITMPNCNADLSVRVWENDSAVVVAVRIRNDTSNDCADGLTIELEQPLGDRLLIDLWDWNRIPMRGE